MEFNEKYGPWAVIAGASEGTGSAFAREVAAQGVNCLLIARREGPLKTLAADISANNAVECLTASIDLSADNAAQDIAAATGSREVGLFVSNAGADTVNKRFLDRDIDRWIELVNRNVTTVVRCCHHFGGQMRKRKRGGILLVGSGSCYGGASYMAVYAGTKAFNLCFGESLWAELRPHGVHVLNLILGRTDTPALRETLSRQGLPVPPDLVCPDEVAAAGLARLPHGPVHNWGQESDEKGFAPNSPRERRTRIMAIDAATSDIFKDG